MEPIQISFSELNFVKRDVVTIKGTILVSVPKDRMWEIITSAGYLGKIHPFCKKNDPVVWNKVGQKDTGFFYSGKMLSREIIEFVEGKYYSMNVDGIGTSRSIVTFSTEEVSGNTCHLSIQITSYAFKNTPRPLWLIYARKKIEQQLKEYLYSVLNGAKYYAETGNPVKRNQFGSHKKFSP